MTNKTEIVPVSTLRKGNKIIKDYAGKPTICEVDRVIQNDRGTVRIRGLKHHDR